MKYFIDAFFESVHIYPDNTAVMDKNGSYSYTELDRKSNFLAHDIIKKANEQGNDIPSLRSEGKNGIRVAVLLPRTKDFMIAVIGILRAGCAVVPIDTEYPAERINFILEDSDTGFLITDKSNREKVSFSGNRIIFIESIVSANISASSLPEYNYSDPNIEGYLFYTSGSTGKPKGVIHTRRILNNAVALLHHIQFSTKSRLCSVTAFTFVSSLFDLTPALMFGGSVYIADDNERKNIFQLDNLLKEQGITGAFMAPILYHSLRAMPGVHFLDYVILGGEKFKPVENIPDNLYEAYGSTEIGFTFIRKVTQDDDPNLLGMTIPGISLSLQDNSGKEIESTDCVGELCVAGPFLALGYNKRPEENSAYFIPCPFEEGKKMFRTGDYFSRDENRNYYFHGRKDRMIKLRGYRIELDEIETVMQNVPEVKECAVLVVKVNDTDKIACYYSLKDKNTATHSDYFKSILKEKLPEYMLPEFMIELDAIPRNSNGKKDYLKLKSFENKTEEYIAPRTEKEKILCRAFANVLKISEDKVGIEDNFYALGGDSMSAIRLINYLHKENIILSVADLMKWKTVKAIAETVTAIEPTSENSESDQRNATQECTPESIMKETGWTLREWNDVATDFASRGEKIEKIYPLLPLQEVMLAKHIADPKSWDYRLVFIYELEQVPTEQQLRNVLDCIAIKHEVLRTAIIYENVLKPFQAIVSRKLGLSMVSVENESDPLVAVKKMREEILTNGFDLQKKPLFKLTCVKKSENSCYIILALHHIIVDGWCMDILEKDFERFLSDELNGVAIRAVPNCPRIYEKAVRELVGKDKNSALSYWKNLLSDYEDRAEIPHYATIPEENRSVDNKILAVLPCSVVNSLTKVCRRQQATLMNGLELAWALLLNTYTRLEDVVFAKVINGRDQTTCNLSDVFGLFINTILVRIKWDNKNTANQLLKNIHQQSIETKPYEYTPLSSIISQNNLGAKIYQSILSLRNYIQEEKSSLIDIKPVIKRQESSNELEVSMELKKSGDLEIEITYDTALYSEKTITQILKTYQVVIQGIVDNPDIPLSQIPRLSEEDKLAVLKISRGEELPYDTTQTWVDKFHEQALKQPDHLAVVDSVSSITYAEMDRQSNAIANYLIQQGVKENDFVSIKMDRVKEFPIAVLGINKAGAAYVPIDPDYPEERINYMQEDSQAKIILNESIFADIMQQKQNEEYINKAKPDTFAYMIYTSGSTGKPKGTLLSHSNIMACAVWNIREFQLDCTKKNLHHPSFSFDAATFDLFYPLMAGSEVHIISSALRQEPSAVSTYIKEKNITGMTTATAFGMLLLNQYDTHLEYIMLGGEQFFEVKRTATRLYNGYGPTEFTVCSSYHQIDQDRDKNIPIGRPVPNSSSFICDIYGNLLPLGAAGELCLYGTQMAKGYWNNPEKTNAAFVECPFMPGQKMYRTGDLARYNEDGELMYLGRLDRQVKLRGFRIELGEIETRASQFTSVEKAVAEVREEQLCLYYTASGKIDITSFKSFLGQTLPEYMIPVAYMQLDSMPMTPSGKIDRKKLPEPQISTSSEYIAPRNDMEIHFAETMQRILGIDHKIGITDNFYELGGDSIKAIRLTSALRKYNINISISDILQYRTIEKILELGSAYHTEKTIAQDTFEGVVEDSAIVSYFKQLNLPKPDHFNQCILLKCKAKINRSALQTALDALIIHHDMLRAVWDGNNLIVKGSEQSIPIEEYTVSSKSEISDCCQKIQGQLDIKNKMLRVVLFHLFETDYIFIAIHHLIVDGISWRILCEDLESGYEQIMMGTASVTLPSKTAGYKEYVSALKEYSESYMLKKEIPYWKNTLNSLAETSLSVDTDYSRVFNSLDFILSPQKTTRLKEAKLSMYGLEINDLLLTAICRSYANITGNKNISLQLEGHGRENIGKNIPLDRTIGWFTSLYPVYISNLTGNIHQDLITVKETLHRVPHKGFGYNILRFFKSEIFGGIDCNTVPSLSFNYLGEMDSENRENSYFSMTTEIDTGLSFAKENCFGSDININCYIMNGIFTCMLSYNTAKYAEQDIYTFGFGFLRELETVPLFLSECSEKVITMSELGETEWSLEEYEGMISDFQSRGEQLLSIYPLTAMQEGILFKYISEPNSWAYRMAFIYSVSPVPTKTQLRRAIDRLCEKYEVLRTAILYDGVQIPRQAITDRKIPLSFYDISQREDKTEAIRNIRTEILNNNFDLQRKPLFSVTCARVSDTECYLIPAIHHIIVDGWSLAIYMGELQKYLSEEYTGQITTENITALSGLYEKAVRNLHDKDMETSLAYWDDLLFDYENPSEIPSYGIIPEDKQSNEELLDIVINSSVTDQLQALCQTKNVTLNTALELTWAMVLQTYSRQDDVVFGKVISGRDAFDMDVNNLVGLFINTIPIRVTFSRETTASQILNTLIQQANTSKQHEFCSVSEIQSRHPLGNKLFQSVFVFENYDGGMGNNPQNISVTVNPIFYKEENFNEITASVSITRQNEIVFDIAFDKTKFAKADITGVLSCFKNLLMQITQHPDTPLLMLPKLSREEEISVLELSKGEEIPYDHTQTWVDLFHEQALKQPDHIAVVDSVSSITYTEMDKQADVIARYLIELGVKENDFVAVKMERVKEFSVAVLGINKAGAAYVPIDPDYPEERINYMLEDSQAKIILTESILADIINQNHITEYINKATPNTFAYMIYTSGSTGKPKGVMILQKSLMNLAAWHNVIFEQNPETKHLAQPSFSFDASITELFCPLTAGATIFIADSSVRRDLNLLAECIIRNEITELDVSPQVGMELINNYDLPVKYFLFGGEKLFPVRATPYIIYNGYGPTEFTVDAIYHRVNPKEEDIPIGRPIPNSFAFICDSYGNLLPKGVAGEICLAGIQLAEGYWNNPEKTKDAFVDCPFIPGEKMYRTGDLARYNEDGNIMYLGRLDRQVKLRGFRIELGEIETRASQFMSINHVAAEVRHQQLCLYYTAPERIDESSLTAFLAQTLPDYMVPVAYMQLDAMPMMPSGKIDRKKLPDPEIIAESIIPPSSEIEKNIYSLVSQYLPEVQFGITNNLISLGVNSIGVMRIAAALYKEYGRQIAVSDIMKHATVQGIAELLTLSKKERRIPRYPEREFYPITENQRGVYIDWERNKNTTQYNIPMMYKFADMDPQKLIQAIRLAVENHPALKTRFALETEEIVQKQQKEETVQIPLTELTQEPDSAFFQGRIHPFDLFNDTLYHIELYIYKKWTYLFIDIHHIIFDGLSSEILLQDILDAYHGKALPGEEITGYDYALYEKEFAQGEEYAQAEARFDNLLAEASVVSYPNSAHPDGVRSAYITAPLPSHGVEAFCRKSNVTINSYLHAAFAETLYRLSREQNALYLTVGGGRSSDIRLSRTIGMFVQSLPVVHKSEGSDSIVDFLQKMHEQLQLTYAMEFYPYTRLVERHNIHAEISFLCQIGLEYHETVFEGLSLDTVKFPISVAVYSQTDGNYAVGIEYDGMRYGRRDMEILLEVFVNVSRNMMKADRVSNISLLNTENTLRILDLSRGEDLPYDKTQTWVDMFHERALKQPDHIAVVDTVSSITYAEMDRQSNAIAQYLMQHGIKQNDFVAIQMGRVKEFPVAVLGINKAAAAYVPAVPDYPEERIKYMLEDSQAKIVLTESLFADIIKEDKGIEWINRTTPDTLAYMIYTSGSTGKPKGVMIAHRALTNLIVWNNHMLHLGADTRNLVQPSFNFDASISDLICPLPAGSTVYIADKEMQHDFSLLADYINQNRITGIDVSLPIGMELINNYTLNLKYMMLGGEKMLSVNSCPYIINVYGPTEFTVTSSTHNVSPNEQDISIGRPVPNTSSFICDSYGNLLPQGIAGELCLYGVQMAEGYWNNPEKTKAAFVECPFIPGKKMYRTGDLAKYNENGELMYLGRLDRQVKLRGFRIELGEIETKASQFTTIEKIVAEVRNEQICLYYTASERIDSDNLKSFLTQTLPKYMVPVAYMQLDTMPITPNGKIDRKKLPEPKIFVGDIVPPSSEIEKKLHSLVSLNIPAVQFGVTNNLLSLGFNSITFMRLSIAIYKEFGKQIAVSDIMKQTTVRGIVTLLSEERKENRIPHYPEQEYYPLTANQIGIYLAWEQNKNTTQYNTPMLYTFDDKDPEKFAESIKTAIRNHPTLQTRLVIKENEIVQQPFKEEPIDIPLQELPHIPERTFLQSRIRPFDVFKDTLYRVELYQYGNTVYLFIDVHHIIFDGFSFEVLFEDILNAYEGKILKSEEITAYDYALYEKEFAQSEAYAQAEARFDTLLAEANTVSYPQSAHPDRVKNVHITTQLPVRAFEDFCKKNHITVNSYFHAAFGETLYRLTREKNPLYITISNGRSNDLRLLNTVGMFVQTLPVVHVGEAQDSVIDFVQKTYNQLQETYELEFYPFTKMVERHHINAEIMFLCQIGTEQTQETMYEDISLDTVKFPLGLAITSQSEDTLFVSLEYDGNRYGKKDMETFFQVFLNIVQNMLTVDNVKDIRLINEEDTLKILALSKGEDLPYNHEETWVDLFLKQVANHPDNIAVLDDKSTITYSEMDNQSNAIAQYLMQNGIKENDFVAVKMGRVKEVPISTLGIFKAGAVYVPIDPDYPEERINYMLEDSNAAIVITEELVAEIIQQYPHAPQINKATPDSLAYMIYTSGSTGKPKGVINYHRGLRNLTACRNAQFEQRSDKKYLVSPSFSFDAAISTTLCPLAVGACVCIANTEQQKDLILLIEFIKKNGIVGVDLSMQFAMELVNHYQLDLQYVLTGGEKMLPLHKLPYKVYNGYGPSEFTVDATYHCVQPDEDDIPIGRPLPNTSAFVCDMYGNLLPHGVAGELCLHGIQMSAGYWHNPEKTKASFTECPFLPQQTMYRTGDLALYNQNNELQFLGRIDTQVKLRGYRIELGEIENRASKFGSLLKIAAEVRHDLLCLYYTSKEQVDKNALKYFMGKALPDYMVPFVYMQMETMPETPSGKIDRKKLPAPDLKSAQTTYVAPTDEVESALVEGMEKILNMKPIGIDDDFFALGGNSISCLKLIGKLDLPGINLTMINKGKTTRRIAKLYKSSKSYSTVRRYSPEQNETALTQELALLDMQTLMLDYQLYSPLSIPSSDLVACLELDESVDLPRFIKALNTVLQHHPVFSSHLIMNKELEICLKYSPEFYIPVYEEHLSEEEFQHIKNNLVKPFEIFNVNLYACRVITTEKHSYFFYNVHHIIADGYSLSVFKANFKRSYMGAKLPPDYLYLYIKEQAELKKTPFYEECKTYFETKYNNKEWTVLPEFDHESDENKADQVLTPITIPDTSFTELFEKYRLSINIFFFTVSLLALAKVTGKKDVYMATLYNGRDSLQQQNMFGLFIREIPLGISLDTNMPIQDLFKTVKELLDEGIARSCYRYTLPNEQIGVSEKITFIYQRNIYADYQSDSIFTMNFVKLPLRQGTFGKLMDLELIDNFGEKSLAVTYESGHYDKQTMQHFSEDYTAILSKLVENKEQNITIGEVLS